MDNAKGTACCFCVLTMALGVGFVAFFSFSSLDSYELGLDYSAITKTLDKTVYTPGYHFLGFGHTFIIYPSTVQNMEFSTESTANRPPIRSRTEDGLFIQFKASFQYLLQQDKLYDLYMRYGEDYETPCEKFAVDVLNDQATLNDANLFFFDNDGVAQKMRTALSAVFEKECFASIQFFQLSGIDLPDKFEKAIDDTEIARQDIVTAEAERTNRKIELETTVSQAKISQDVITNRAKAEAEGNIAKNEARMRSFVDIQTQQADAYANLKKNLNLTGAQLIEYIRSKVVNLFSQNNMVVSIPQV